MAVKCGLSCDARRQPAIGIANLRGLPGTPVAGYSTVIPLCRYHFDQADGGSWVNVTLEGWEAFPEEEKRAKVTNEAEERGSLAQAEALEASSSKAEFPESI